MIALSFLPFLTVISLALAGLIGFAGGHHLTKRAEQLVKCLAVAALVFAACSALFLGVNGQTHFTLPIYGVLAFHGLIDPVSITMLCLVAFLAWVIVTYALSYLRREGRQGTFIGYLGLTLASVSALVQSANLAQFAFFWIFTSLMLHRLLLFYGNRPAAKRAQRKKFVIARLGDAALLGAFWLVYQHFGSLDISTIAANAHTLALNGTAGWIVGLLAIAAMMKSAQFPTHGWIIEVMETPTPVSALLHAGIVNAGGFLLIRLSDVVVMAPSMMVLIALLGLFTAIFGSIVMITQPAVKTRLAWSTISQMGFMILQCGLGLFALALLHIVAHSLYKANAFLSSGSMIEKLHKIRQCGPQRTASSLQLATAFALSLLICILASVIFGAAHDPAVIALSVVVVFAISQFALSVLGENGISRKFVVAVLGAIGVCIAYFGFHTAATYGTAAFFPVWQGSPAAIWALSITVIISFALLGLMQTWLLAARHRAGRSARLYIHISNGFYINAYIDRIAGTWRSQGSRAPQSGEKA